MKILVVRTIQSDLLSAFLNELKDEYPVSEIYLLDNHKQDTFSEAQAHIAGLFRTRKKGDYGITNIAIKTIGRIRKAKFDQSITNNG